MSPASFFDEPSMGPVKRGWAWVRSLRTRRFLANVTLLTGGTLVGQAVFMLLSPVLSRLYTPEAFGLFGVFVSTTSVLAVIATLRYEFAIPLPRREDEARALVWVASSAALLFGLGLILAARPLAAYQGLWLSSERPADTGGPLFWVAVAMGVVALSLYQILSYWLMRGQRYRGLAASKAAMGSMMAVAQLLARLAFVGGWGLISGWLAGTLAALGVGATVGRPRKGASRLRPWLRSMQPRLWWRMARRFGRFPLFTMPAGLMNAVAVELPLLLSASLFGPQVAGWFSFARRIVYAPMRLVGRSVAQVYIGTLSAAIQRHDPQALRLFDRLSRQMFVLAAGPFVLLGLGAPVLFRWLFGATWHWAGVLLQYLTPAYLLNFVVVPLSQTLNLLERQDWQMGWDATRLVLVLGVFGAAFRWGWDFQRTFLVYSAVSALMYGVFYGLMRRALVLYLQSAASQDDGR